MAISFWRSISLVIVFGSMLGKNACCQRVVVAPVPANAIVYDPITRKIWATVGSAGKGEMANSIVSIDPATGAVGKPVFIGSEPGGMVLSAQSKYLYVSFGHAVKRFRLATQAPELNFPIGEGLAVTALQTVPDNPEAVVIMRHRPGISPNDAGVAIYDNGVAQPQIVNAGHHLAPGISPFRLYGYENQISSWAFTAMTLTREGIRGGVSGPLIGGNVGLCGTANGLVITNNGGVIDPERREDAGRLPGTGLEAALLPDGSTGSVYQLSGDGNHIELKAYDLRRFTLSNTKQFDNIHGTSWPTGPIRWGDDGIAFIAGDRVVILHNVARPTLPEVDLEVKRPQLPAAVPAAPLTYTLAVSNRSGFPSTGAYLTDVLPRGAEVDSVKSSQGYALFAGGIVRADLGPIPAGATASVEVTVRLPSALASPLFLAIVRGNEPDPSPINNMNSAQVSPEPSPLPDLTGAWLVLGRTATGRGPSLRTIDGEFVVWNAGRRASVPCKLRFYLSSSPHVRTSSSQLLQEITLPALSRNRSYTAVLKAPLGPPVDAKDRFVLAVIDATDENMESNKGNNVVRAMIR